MSTNNPVMFQHTFPSVKKHAHKSQSKINLSIGSNFTENVTGLLEYQTVLI